MRYFIIIFISLVLNANCSIYPFNLNAEEYFSLTKKQKLYLWEKQAYQKSDYEDDFKENEFDNKMIVSITNGNFKHMKNRYHISTFEILKHEVKKIPVYDLQYNTVHHYIWVTYQNLGLYIGVKAHKQYRTSSYILDNNDYFSKITYLNKPAIVLTPKYKRSVFSKKVSFIGMYNGRNLDVKIRFKK